MTSLRFLRPFAANLLPFALAACVAGTSPAPSAGAPPSAAHAGAAAVLGPHSVSAGPTVPVTPAGPIASAPVEVGIVAFNDFHGHLLPPREAVIAPDGKGGTVAVPAGGAAWFAGAVDSIRARYPNHMTVSAGDLISGSPITSSLFLDEPTVGVMNRIGVDFNAVGNHEFDRGRDELMRMAKGGCAKYTLRQPCALEPYAGADFPFLAANTLTESGRPLFPATGLKSFGSGKRRVTIGVIGLTLRGTGDLSPPETHKGLTWADEADTANALVPRLKGEGADVIVLLIHQGGRTDTTRPDPNGCDGFYGDIKPILARLDPRVDLVISGHTHWAYVCDYPSRDPAHHFLLTSAGLWGEMVTDIDLKIDPEAHRLVSARAHNIIVQSEGFTTDHAVAPTDLYPRFQPRADIAAYVQRYVDAAAAMARRQIGWLGAPAVKMEGRLGNTGGPLGRLVADSQLAATRGAGAQIAFMNPFGLRTSLFPAADRTVTFGQIYAVEPFNNELITQALTGREIKDILEQGFDGNGPEQVLTPSMGFTYSYDRSRPVGSRIMAMKLDGQPIRPAQTYRVTTSSFLANGGDSFTGFLKGRERRVGMIDVTALEAWLTQWPARMAPEKERAIDLRPDLNTYSAPAPPGHHY